MKRSIALILAVMVIFLYHTSTYAVEAIMDTTNILNDDIAQTLSSQLTIEEKELLNSIEDLNLSNVPILKIYNEVYWSLASAPAKEMIAEADMHAQTRNYKDYYILSKQPYRIRVSNNCEATKVSEELPQYINDIIGLSNHITCGEKQFAIKGVYCFDGSDSHDGIIVFILTDECTIVKYYEYPHSEAILLSETDFQVYANDYYEYLTSYDHNFNENGEPVGGGTLSFKAFIDSRYIARNEPALEIDNGPVHLWIIVTFVLTIPLSITGYAIYKKYKH